MTRRSLTFVVCSPRPRVGRTLVSRLLIEFMLINGRPVAGFDVNPNEFPLGSFLPAYTAIADISDTRGQMGLFDELVAHEDTVKVVDLGSGPFDRFFQLARDIGFVEEARRRGIEPVILFLADPEQRTRQAFSTLKGRFPSTSLVPVLNDAVTRGYPFPEGLVPQGAQPVRIPMLPAVLHRVIERPNFSFAEFLQRPVDQPTELHDWIKRIFIEFRELELRLLLEQLRLTISI
jgi:hypothetical protein